MKRIIIVLMATFMFMCLTPGISNAVIIDFEDLPYTSTYAKLPNSYMGYYWYTFDYFHRDFYNGVNSGLFAINNNAANTYIDFGSVVDFNGAYFTQYSGFVTTVTITGYYNEQILYERVLTPEDLSIEPKYIQLDFNGITRITFYSLDAQFFMDDLDITPVSNQPPIANCGDDMVVFEAVALDGSASYDPDGWVDLYEWELKHRKNSAYDRVASGVNPTISNLESGFYDVTLTVTDDGGLSDTDTILIATAGPCVCTASTMYVESIVAETVRASKGRHYGEVIVTIFDDYVKPVSGAIVSGTFSGDFNVTGSGVTSGNGIAVIRTTGQVKKPLYEFCVDLVVKEPLSYVPEDNVETCKSN